MKGFKEPKIPHNFICIGPGRDAIPKMDSAGNIKCVKEPPAMPKDVHYIPSASSAPSILSTPEVTPLYSQVVLGTPQDYAFVPSIPSMPHIYEGSVAPSGERKMGTQIQQQMAQVLEAQASRSEKQGLAAKASQEALGGSGAPYYIGGILKYPGMSEALFEQQRVEFADLRSPQAIQEEILKEQRIKEINEAHAAQKAKLKQESDAAVIKYKLQQAKEFEDSNVGKATKLVQQAEEVYACKLAISKNIRLGSKKVLADQQVEAAAEQLKALKAIKEQASKEAAEDRCLEVGRARVEEISRAMQAKEKQDILDAQQARLSPSKKEVEKIKIAPPKQNSPEVEEHSPLIIHTLKQHGGNYDGFHKQVTLKALPVAALHTLSLKKTVGVDSSVADLVFDLLRDKQLPSLKILDLRNNPKSIGMKQINKLTDSFLSGNNALEVLDISCLYPVPVDRDWRYREERGEHLGADSLSREMPDLGRSFNQLVLSASTCSQPLCITIDSTIPFTFTGNSKAMTALEFGKMFGGWKSLQATQFKTTGPAMIKHMSALCDQHGLSKAGKGENFTWGITKCLTPVSDIRNLDMREYAFIKNGVGFAGQYEPNVQALIQKIKMFVCINEAMDGRIISHDMLEYEGTLSPKGIPIPLKEVGPAEVPEQLVKSFASSCIGCDEARFNRESFEGVPDSRSIMMKKLMGGAIRDTLIDLSHSSMDSGEAGNAAHLIANLVDVRQVDLSNNSIAYMGVIAHFMGQQIVTLNISNNSIGDPGAEAFGNALIHGYHPSLKYLDISGNNITATGREYLAQALNNVSQDLSIAYNTIKGFSKEKLTEAIKFILHLNKENGVSSNEMFTTKQSLERCKKAVENVGVNITVGVAKCTKTPLKYSKPTDLTLQDMALDFLAQTKIGKVLKPIASFICISQEAFSSIIDEDFSQCLTGLDSMLEE